MYVIKYYDAQFTKASSASKFTAKRTWYFDTNDKGAISYNSNFISLDKSYKGRSSELFYDTNSKTYSIPAGTITIKEVKAPAGFLLNDEVNVVNFIMDDEGKVRANKGTWNTTNKAEDLSVISEEQPVTGGAMFRKLDAKTGAGVNGATISVKNASGKAITYNGKSYKDGAEVMAIVTKTTTVNGKSVVGIASTGNVLPEGKYKATETVSPDTVRGGLMDKATGEKLPDAIDVAVENSMKLSSLPEWPDYHICYFSKTRYESGITTANDGTTDFRICDIEKTVVDIPGYRNNVGIEETKEILQTYLGRKDRNLRF